MKCKICDQVLTDNESVRKDRATKEYLDTCTHCLIMSNPYYIEAMEEKEDLILDFLNKRWT